MSVAPITARKGRRAPGTKVAPPTAWQPMETYKPRRYVGRHVIFWQPATGSGAGRLAARVTDNPGQFRETTHWAEVTPPGAT